MSEQHRMVISIDGGKNLSCMPFGVQEIGLDIEGVTDIDQAAVRVSCVKDVLYVMALGNRKVTLERNGRRKLLGAAVISLLPDDVLFFEGHCIEIVKIWKKVEPQTEKKSRRFPSLKKMFGAAAAFFMAAVPACQPRGMGDVPNPQVDRPSDDDDTAPVVDVVEMGEPVDPNYENYEWVKAQREEEARKAEEAKKQADPWAENVPAPEGDEAAWEAVGFKPRNVDIQEMGDVFNTQPNENENEIDDKAQVPLGMGMEPLMDDADKATTPAPKVAPDAEEPSPKAVPEVVEVKKKEVKPRRLAGKPPAGGPKKGGK